MNAADGSELPDDYDRAVGGRITFIEALARTALLIFLGAMASGVFDGMLAWR